jgi:hypothetical protein
MASKAPAQRNPSGDIVKGHLLGRRWRAVLAAGMPGSEIPPAMSRRGQRLPRDPLKPPARFAGPPRVSSALESEW